MIRPSGRSLAKLALILLVLVLGQEWRVVAHTLSRQRPGAMMLFKMAGPEPEGVLMVVGGEPGDAP